MNPEDSQGFALADEFRRIGDALDDLFVGIVQIVNDQDSIGRKLAQYGGQVLANLHRFMHDVGKHEIEFPRQIPEIARFKRHILRQTMFPDLILRVFRGRKAEFKGFLELLADGYVVDAMNLPEYLLRFFFGAKIEIDGDEIHARAEALDGGADGCRAPAVKRANLQDSPVTHQFDGRVEVKRIRSRKPSGDIGEPESASGLLGGGRSRPLQFVSNIPKDCFCLAQGDRRCLDAAMVQHLHHLRALAGLNTGSEFFKKGYRFLGTSSARQQDDQVRRGLDVVGVEREGLRETAFGIGSVAAG